MKSNVCRIDQGTKDLEAIFRESEKVAAYNGLTPKQTLQLRLLCEEMDGMLPNVIEDFEGKFWIEYNEGVCKIHVSIEIPEMNIVKKEELISIAKNKTNAAAVGVIGRIRNAIENYLLDDTALDTLVTTPDSYYLPMANELTGTYSHVWTLENYKSNVNKDESGAWDELEKSVIASLADDVIIGVKGNKADIIIIKKFA